MTTHVAAKPQPAPGAGEPVTPNEPGILPEDQPALRPWAVVAGWAVLLGVLSAVGAAFGNNAVVEEISGGAAGLALVIAAAVWLDLRLRPNRGVLALPVRLGGVVLFAVAACLVLLGLAFGEFMPMIAAVPLAAGIGVEIAARRAMRARAGAAGRPGR